jgi:hypothetical protein
VKNNIKTIVNYLTIHLASKEIYAYSKISRNRVLSQLIRLSQSTYWVLEFTKPSYEKHLNIDDAS